MINKLPLKPFLVFALLVILAGCQPASVVPPPLPLTGTRASKLGGVALVSEYDNTSDKSKLAPVLPATGKPLSGYAPVDLGSGSVYSFSRNREQMAFVTYNTASCQKMCFHLLDLRTWQESFPPIELDQFPVGYIVEVVFDGRGQRAAFAINNRRTQKASCLSLISRRGRSQPRPAWTVSSTTWPLPPAASWLSTGHHQQPGRSRSWP